MHLVILARISRSRCTPNVYVSTTWEKMKERTLLGGRPFLVLRPLAPWEPPLPVSCPTDGLAELPRKHSLVKTPLHGVVLLLAAEGGTDLSGSPFRLGAPHQASMLSPLPEVHAPRYPGPDLSGPADSQRLRKNDVG